MENTASARAGCSRQCSLNRNKPVDAIESTKKQFFLQEILSLRSIKTNNRSVDNFKKFSSMSCTLEPGIQSFDTGQRMPFLTADHNIDVHWMSRKIVYTLQCPVITRISCPLYSSQSERAYYCRHIIRSLKCPYGRLEKRRDKKAVVA